MKRLTLLFLFILSPALLFTEETPHLKLRVARHPDFARVVLEGPETLIFKGFVIQKGQDISVSFQEHKFLVEDVMLPFPYKIVKNSVVFSPGEFKRFKTTFLKSPARLVIDIYQEEKAAEVKRIEGKTGFLKSKTIIIDPGHGGYEYGLIKDNQREKDVVLNIAKRLRALIIEGSTQCFLTRMGDQFLSLQERANFSNNKNGDIFLSLHIGRHKDIVIYAPVITESAPEDSEGTFIKKTERLQDTMKGAIKKTIGEDMVSIKPLPYSVLSKVKGASLIIELPFFEDVDYNEEFKAKLATTIYKGLYLYEDVTTD